MSVVISEELRDKFVGLLLEIDRYSHATNQELGAGLHIENCQTCADLKALRNATPVQAPVVPTEKIDILKRSWWYDYLLRNGFYRSQEANAWSDLIVKKIESDLASAPQVQAPMVPSVEELEEISRGVMDRNLGPITVAQAIHAHLLTHGWREGAAWIPVSERLPETYWPVVCYYDLFDSQFVGKLTSSGGWIESQTGLPVIIDRVTHWQPLPEPPSTPTPDLSHESRAPWIVVDAFPAPLLFWCPMHRWVGRVEKAALFFSYSEALDIAEKHQAHVVPLESVQESQGGKN